MRASDPLLRRLARDRRTAAWGHEDQFRPPSLNGGYRLGKATFAGMGGKEENAPKADRAAIKGVP